MSDKNQKDKNETENKETSSTKTESSEQGQLSGHEKTSDGQSRGEEQTGADNPDLTPDQNEQSATADRQSVPVHGKQVDWGVEYRHDEMGQPVKQRMDESESLDVSEDQSAEKPDDEE